MCKISLLFFNLSDAYQEGRFDLKSISSDEEVHNCFLIYSAASHSEQGAMRVSITQFSRCLTTSARLVSKRNAPAPTVYVDTGLVVAAVGRPNVGKSTLFNALASAVRGRGSGSRDNPSSFVFVRSVVDAMPGVTRDPRSATGAVGDLMFTIVDTPGLERPLDVRATRDLTPASVSDICAPRGPLPSLVASAALCEDAHYRSLYESMEVKTVHAVREADIAMLVLDAADGLTPLDESIAAWLRAECLTCADPQKRVMLVANKCDRRDAESGAMEAYGLGLGEPIALSGEHKLGFGDLYNYLNSAYQMKMAHKRAMEADSTPPVKYWTMSSQFTDQNEPEPVYDVINDESTLASISEDTGEDHPFDDEMVVGIPDVKGEEPLTSLIVSIIGRPNVGKSTLLNRLVGEEASLVGPASGVTRDAVLCKWEPKTRNAVRADIPVSLIDTAGIRNKSRVDDVPLERLSVRSSIRALRHSHVVLIILEATELLNAQDVKLVELAVAEGRAIVIVVNKMDKIALERRKDWRSRLNVEVTNKLHSIPGVEIVEVCASEWDNGDIQAGKLFGAVHRARARWEKRVTTSGLNRFLRRFNERALIGGNAQSKRNRTGVAKFMSQKKIRPPMFRIDGANAVSQNYLRSLSNELRHEFGFEGVPIRIKRPSRRT